MMDEISRPLDLLNELRGKKVLIKTRESKDLIKAQLISFDIHINLVVMKNKKREFIRGDLISSIAEE